MQTHTAMVNKVYIKVLNKLHMNMYLTLVCFYFCSIIEPLLNGLIFKSLKLYNLHCRSKITEKLACHCS